MTSMVVARLVFLSTMCLFVRRFFFPLGGDRITHPGLCDGPPPINGKPANADEHDEPTQPDPSHRDAAKRLLEFHKAPLSGRMSMRGIWAQ